MANTGRHFTTDRAMRANPALEIVISNHARASMELRSISVADVERALREGPIERVVDEKTGRYVFRLDDNQGSLRLVAQRRGNSIVVLSAVRPEELQNVR